MKRSPRTVAKARTGIAGLDHLLEGGIPRGRTTMVHGGTGTGKTILALQCLAHGAAVDHEPGVFLSFGENVTEARENGAALGLDLAELETQGTLIIDSALVDPDEVTSAGEATLATVFVRLEEAIERIGAKRVAIDAINVLAQILPSPVTVRAQLKRVFDGLKRRGVTTIVTHETRGPTDLAIEEYLSDCVIHLEQSAERGITTRRLQIVKYRGSSHRVNVYPYVITSRGLTLTPPVAAEHVSSDERLSVGIPGVDSMLAGGVYRGSTVLVSGTAGAGKTSIAVSMAVAACARGERCLLLALEEQASQITRNLQTIGLDIPHWTEQGLLRIRSPRSSLEGLEAYLAYVLDEVEAFGPHLVIIDPLTPLMALGRLEDTRETIIRLLGILKARNITVLSTILARERHLEEQNTPLASFVDAIILLRNVEEGDERNRTVSILKARGIAHSRQVRRFRLTPGGVDLLKTKTRQGRDEGPQGESA